MRLKKVAQLVALVAVGSCCPAGAERTLAPAASPSREECVAQHWLDLNRYDGLRLFSVIVPDRSRREVLEAIRHELETTDARRTAPPRYRDPLNDSTALLPDPLATTAERVVRERIPEARMMVLPLVSKDGIVMDRRSSPATFVAPVVASWKTLANRGDVTDIVQSQYGLHLLVLLETVPGHTADDAEIDRFCPPRVRNASRTAP